MGISFWQIIIVVALLVIGRHYDSDEQLYAKFTAETGIKVNVAYLRSSF